jgi:hypothetical protein
VDCGLWIADCGLRKVDCRLVIIGHWPSISDGRGRVQNVCSGGRVQNVIGGGRVGSGFGRTCWFRWPNRPCSVRSFGIHQIGCRMDLQ